MVSDGGVATDGASVTGTSGSVSTPSANAKLRESVWSACSPFSLLQTAPFKGSTRMLAEHVG